MLTTADLERLRTCTHVFMRHLYWVKHDFGLTPNKDHIGSFINYMDLKEMREGFCDELINTIVEWVYSKQKASGIINDLINREGRSEANAQSALRQNAFKKFRRAEKEIIVQGQFGELLLFNLLQSFFNAVPLIRKMPIAIADSFERIGADAIHYSVTDNGKHLLYLGEAKTYTSKYQFAKAFETGLKSIIDTYDKHLKELRFYIYDDFIEDELIQIAIDYKNGTLKDCEVHLVAVITYNETEAFNKTSEKEIKESIEKIIKTRCSKLNADIFAKIDAGLHPRFNYILIPIWELDELLKEFEKLIGI